MDPHASPEPRFFDDNVLGIVLNDTARLLDLPAPSR